MERLTIDKVKCPGAYWFKHLDEPRCEWHLWEISRSDLELFAKGVRPTWAERVLFGPIPRPDKLRLLEDVCQGALLMHAVLGMPPRPCGVEMGTWQKIGENISALEALEGEQGG